MSESEDKEISIHELHKTLDARLWAQEFIRNIKDAKELALIDQDYMIGWFANSIMTGCDIREKQILDYFANDKVVLDKLLEIMPRYKFHYYDITTYIDPNPEVIDDSLMPKLHFIGNIVEDDGDH